MQSAGRWSCAGCLTPTKTAHIFLAPKCAYLAHAFRRESITRLCRAVSWTENTNLCSSFSNFDMFALWYTFLGINEYDK